jgi:hypothetical protein
MPRAMHSTTLAHSGGASTSSETESRDGALICISRDASDPRYNIYREFFAEYQKNPELVVLCDEDSCEDDECDESDDKK